MVNYSLCYSNISLSPSSGLTITSLFSGCPNCGYKHSTARSVGNINRPNINIQALLRFNCPNCTEQLRLQVGVYRSGGGDIKLCIQRGDLGALDLDWWVEDT